jgi:cytosolic 5'-nucleotidase 3
MSDHIIISNQKNLDLKLSHIQQAGPEAVSFVSDFDRTLTYALNDGLDTSTSASLLQRTKTISDSSIKKLKGYYLKYRAKETDPTLDDKTKAALMSEWWTSVFDVYIQQAVSKQLIHQTIEEHGFPLRNGCVDLLNILKLKKIPLLIFSAGVGDVIQHYLNHQRLNFSNIGLISNFLIYNQSNEVVDYQRPIIHSLNKTAAVIKDDSPYKNISSRKNVILLGDSTHDPFMVNDDGHDCVLRVGFLNNQESQFLDTYKQLYDVVILKDQGLDYVVELVNKLT